LGTVVRTLSPAIRGIPVLAVVLLSLFSVRPAHSTELSEVRHWLYLIDVNLDESTVNRIANSAYDMVVVDYIPSESENTDYPMTEVVARWHNAEHPKLVMAYIDIGQAESYRSYWHGDWQIGDPDWITGGDPDGWVENYPVAYWRDEWQSIWLDDDGLIAQIVASGFDGVYLDWVEAYSDPGVAKVAAHDGIDATHAMVNFIADIAALGQRSHPEFLVIGQNAIELIYRADYRRVVDGVSQEQTWFDGGADNNPPGDCPLPARRRDVESATYLTSLSSICRLQHDAFPDSTLHMSSEEYLEDMSSARELGFVVLTVDYATDPTNAAWVREESRRRGFIPFVGTRALDSFMPAFRN
jgi:cysteinyl-tRNA synthetase